MFDTSEADMISRERVRQRLSQRALGRLTSIDVSTIRRIERAEIAADPLQIASIAGALGIRPSDIRKE